MFAPWASNEGAGVSYGPVASLRVQAAEVRAARVSEARANHFVAVRVMFFPFSGQVGMGGSANLRKGAQAF